MHSTDDPKSPTTIFARVLFDADKLDATGPCGLHRWFFEYAKKGYNHHDSVLKIQEHIKWWKANYGDIPFFTPTAKKLGKGRIGYIETRCKEILADMDKIEKF